jgi:hypothetical protein
LKNSWQPSNPELTPPYSGHTLAARPTDGNEAEWLTRKLRIDTRLRALNPQWQIIPWHAGLDTSKLSCHAVTEFPTENGPADYALFVNGILIGIIEAKKVTVNPQNVLEQAKRYARGATNGPGNWNGFRIPFLYATNGEIIWHLDVRLDKLVSRPLVNFHTAAALEEKFAFDDSRSRQWLLDTPPEKITRLRPYQVASIVATESAMLAGKRELLIAMATGTGKTFLTVAQIYRLLESKKFRCILFLVDRKALAAQAVRTFNAFGTSQGNKLTQEYEVYSQKFQREDFGDDEPFDLKVLPNEYLTNPNSTHTFVYVSTIQRMARNLFGAEGCFPQTGGDVEYEEDVNPSASKNLVGDDVRSLTLSSGEKLESPHDVSYGSEADANKLDIPIHAFDLIIADECHRGYFTADTPKPDAIQDLRDFIHSNATPRFTTFRAFLLQFKVVEIARKRSALAPAGWNAPYYRSELYLEPNRKTGISQHEALRRLSGLQGASVSYVCPMIFEEHDVLKRPKFADLQFVDVASSPTGWLTNERHFISFQTPTAPPTWCSKPVPGKALEFEEILRRATPFKLEGLLRLLSNIREKLLFETKTGVESDSDSIREVRSSVQQELLDEGEPNLLPSCLSIIAEVSK